MAEKTSQLHSKRARTRSTLIHTAKVLVHERAHQKISIQDITDKAGVGLGTFYNYFETKQALYEAVLSEMRDSFKVELALLRAHLTDPATIVAVSTRYCLLQAQDNREWHDFISMSGVKGENELLQDPQQCREDIQRGASTGRFRVSDAHFTSELVIAMTLHVTKEIRRGKLPRSAIAETTRYILRMYGLPDPVAKALTQAPLPELSVPQAVPQAEPQAEPQASISQSTFPRSILS